MTDLDTIRSLRPVDEPFAEDWSTATLRRIKAPRHPGRRLAALATAAALAGVVATGVGLLRPEAAFAVDRQGDGDVVITIARLADADGLERALAEHGITAEVRYDEHLENPSDLARDSSCLPPVGAVVVDPADNGGVRITLVAEYLTTHDTTLQLTAAGNHAADDWIGVRVEWTGEAC